MEDGISPPPPGVEKVVARMHGSTVGQKALMAVSGLALIGFVYGHMIGHLQMFIGPEAYNRYAHFLQSLGELLWLMRGGLLFMVGLHIFSAIQVTKRNRAARPIAYAETKWLAASMGARTMRISGGLLFFFIIWHLLHFTIMSADAVIGHPIPPFLLKGEQVPDVYARMVAAFQAPHITFIYVACMGMLSLHLSHGIQSALQTLGALNSTYRPFFKKLGPALAGLLFVGFASVPLAILAGVIH